MTLHPSFWITTSVVFYSPFIIKSNIVEIENLKRQVRPAFKYILLSPGTSTLPSDAGNTETDSNIYRSFTISPGNMSASLPVTFPCNLKCNDTEPTTLDAALREILTLKRRIERLEKGPKRSQLQCYSKTRGGCHGAWLST